MTLLSDNFSPSGAAPSINALCIPILIIPEINLCTSLCFIFWSNNWNENSMKIYWRQSY